MSHFTNIKVKGVEDESGRKNYIIKNTDDGSEHVAIKRESGSKYDIGEHCCLTLRQCKQLVSDNRVKHFADAPDAHEAPETTEVPQTWACIDPCALLVLIDGGCWVSSDDIDRTLDAYGWIKPDGERDTLQARENFEKWRKL